jgi:cellulose synthase/poly-beta-1,6-N-acetylglucosamine synthase-like glycosyltransferase
VVRELGGWDENTPTNEDYEFDYRVRQSGKELLFDPRLVIFWETRETVKAFFQQYRRYGRAKYLTLRKHPESAAIRHLIPTGLVATLVAASVIACVRPRWAAAIVAPYAGVIAAATATVAPTLDSAESRRWLPLAFMAMHLGHGIGMWEALLVGARPEGGRRRG